MPTLGHKNETSLVYSQGCCPTTFFNLPISQSQITVSSKPRSSTSENRHNFAAATASSIFPNTQFTNHESLPSLEESFTEFVRVYSQYSETEQVDRLRAKEYYHLSVSNRTCLDYIGIGLFSYYQLQSHDTMKTQIASSSIPQVPQYVEAPFFSISYKTGNLKTLLLHGGQESEFETAMRKKIMGFLNISDNDYFMVFTANRTSAFKLVAEAYPFQSNKKLLTVYDYESEAVETMISCSERRGGKAMSAEFSWPRLRIQTTKLRKMIEGKRKGKKRRGLFVFPLHSRVTGARYPYLWMSVAQENGWHVLIDACALSPKDMDSFGLSVFRPDFLICSFYKLFGENPSGFGCLFVKKSAISLLEASSCGGIVNLIPEKRLFQLPEDSNSNSNSYSNCTPISQKELESLTSFSGRIETKKVEEGVLSKLQITESAQEKPNPIENQERRKGPEGEIGSFDIECRCLDQVDSLGLTVINNRGRYLVNWLVNSLLKLKHPNTEGVHLIKIYGPKIRFDRGPALAFNVFDWKGSKVEPVLVQKLADRNNISLSYGFLHHLCFADKYVEGKGRVLQTKDGGKDGEQKLGITVVTAAIGFLANFEDIYKLWAFLARFLDADFVEKERWRYTSLNQKTIEI